MRRRRPNTGPGDRSARGHALAAPDALTAHQLHNFLIFSHGFVDQPEMDVVQMNIMGSSACHADAGET